MNEKTLPPFLQKYISDYGYFNGFKYQPIGGFYRHVTLATDIGHYKAGEKINYFLVDFVNCEIVLYNFYEDDDGLSEEVEYNTLVEVFNKTTTSNMEVLNNYIKTISGGSYQPTLAEISFNYNRLHEKRRVKIPFKVTVGF
jgi:hypothetical protein